jgi:hypothetical protein
MTILFRTNRTLMLYIQGVLEMAHNIYVTQIYVKYQTKNSNSDLVLDKCFLNYYYYYYQNDINDNPCYFLTLLNRFKIYEQHLKKLNYKQTNNQNGAGIFILLIELCVIDAINKSISPLFI